MSTPNGNTNQPEKIASPIPGEARNLLEKLRPFRGIPLSVTVELGRSKLKLRDLLTLQYHSVFPLDQSAGSRLNVYVNGVLLGKGEPVVAEDQIGIRIDEILDSQH